MSPVGSSSTCRRPVFKKRAIQRPAGLVWDKHTTTGRRNPSKDEKRGEAASEGAWTGARAKTQGQQRWPGFCPSRREGDRAPCPLRSVTAPPRPAPPETPRLRGSPIRTQADTLRRAQPSTQVRRFVLPLVCGHCGRLRLLICACGVHRLIRRRIRHRLGADRAVLAKPPRTFHVKHPAGQAARPRGALS